MKLLIVEDDLNMLKLLKKGFKSQGWNVEVSSDGNEGLYMATYYVYDVIILDWMLPNQDGLDIVKSLRSSKINVPILMLSAKDQVNDKVTILNIGVDDYVAKPFSFQELYARVNALYRRALSQSLNTIDIGEFVLDLDSRMIQNNVKSVQLTEKEYELLVFLYKYKNKIVSFSMISEQLWNENKVIESNVIQVIVYTLRKKIKKKYIKSYKGLGYQLNVE